MGDFLSEMWSSPGFRYVGATLIGFLIAFGAESIGAYLERRRLRSAVREALAEELADNLFVLDAYWHAFKSNVKRREGQFSWPNSRLRTAMLQRCLDSSVIAALSEIEQVQSALGYYQAEELTSRLERDRLAVHKEPRMAPNRSEMLLQHLPYVAQTFMDLLVNVLAEQQVFSSSRSASMAHRLIPLHRANQLGVNRIWRTSLVPQSQRTGQYLIAWQNDAMNLPESMEVIEIRPTEGPHRTVNLRKTYWWARWPSVIERRWRLRRLQESIARFPDMK